MNVQLPSRLARAALLALPLLLGACRMTGPDYQRPALATPTDWRATPTTPTAAAPLDATWWRLYADPTLDDLATRALAANQDLRKAVARLDEARATLRAAVADARPSATLNQTDTRSRTSANGKKDNNANSGGPSASPQNNHRVTLDTSYEIDLWGRVRRSLENAQAQLDAQDASTQTVLLTLTTDLARNYFDLRALDAELAILDRTTALRRDTLATYRARVAAGLGVDADISRAETDIANTEADAFDVARRRARIETALAVLCGEPPATFRLPARLDPLGLPPSVPPGLPSDLLLRRPDIAEAERLAAAQSAAIGATQAGFLPTVRLTGSAGFESVELKDLASWDSRLWSIGPSVSLPLFKGAANRANLKAAEARHEQAVAEYRRRALIAFREVEDALADARAYADQAAAQARALDAAQRTAAYYEQRLAGGLIGSLEAVDSQRSLLQAERAAVQTLGDRYAASLALIKALGGGWLPAASAQLDRL
jgi:multidrug efflux system outer membrane protein